jgi:predicted dehydrogenase
MTTLAFLGAGRMATTHAAALAKLPGVRLGGVFDPLPAAASAFCGAHAGCRAYASVEELHADPGIDGVLICNFTDQHFASICALLAAGKTRLFCEKALVNDRAQGETLLRLADETGAVIMVGHHRRYIPAYARLRELVLSGRLGRVRMVKIAYCGSSYRRDWGDFFADHPRSGGVALDMMSHWYDQLHWYFGRPVSIQARSLMVDRSLPLPMDYFSATLCFAPGIICNLDASWQRCGVDYERIEIYGDEACAVFSGGGVVHLYRPGEHTEQFVGDGDAHRMQMEAFVRLVRDGEKPINGLAEGFAAACTGLDVIAAARSGETLHCTVAD